MRDREKQKHIYTRRRSPHLRLFAICTRPLIKIEHCRFPGTYRVIISRFLHHVENTSNNFIVCFSVHICFSLFYDHIRYSNYNWNSGCEKSSITLWSILISRSHQKETHRHPFSTANASTRGNKKCYRNVFSHKSIRDTKILFCRYVRR